MCSPGMHYERLIRCLIHLQINATTHSYGDLITRVFCAPEMLSTPIHELELS